LTGQTGSSDFPTTPGSFDTTFNGDYSDTFVAKLNVAGTALIYATFLGGGGNESGFDIFIDFSGNAYVTGTTNSADFPATPGSFDTTQNGLYDAFMVKLNATGTALIYASFLGGGGDEKAHGIAVDSSGNAYVTGQTDSADFPATPGSFDATYNGSRDVFLAKLDAAGGVLVYATFLGGGDNDFGYGIVVDSPGSAYVTGYTRSADFPAASGSFDTTYNGGEDAFVAKLNALGSGLVYATFLGTNGEDLGYGIAVDSSGNAYVTGGTYSTDFPVTPGSLDTTYNGGEDAFVAKLNTAGSALVYATFLGGSGPAGSDAGIDIAVDSSGNAYVTGGTYSTDFPVTPGSLDTTYNDNLDVFVAKLDVAGSALVYATFLGGGGYDLIYGIAIDSSRNAYLTGQTGSSDFPATPGSFDITYGDGYDAFVAKLDFASIPMLGATGELNYAADGLDPEAGTAGVTSFVFMVNYTDADNDTPLAGDPKVHILKGGVEIADSPAMMAFFSWVGAPNNYSVGALYQYSTTLTLCGSAYSYYFTASDSTGRPATDWPSPPPDLPDVPCPNHPPVADAGGPYTCVAGETITLDGNGSTDPDGDILVYNWTVHLTLVVTLSGQKPTFACPDTEGAFTVSLNVTDTGSLSGTDDAQLSIQPTKGAAVDWTWPTIAAIVVVAVLLILFFLLRKRRRSDETPDISPTEPSQPPKASSPPR
jgi:hypothetical protein